MIDQDKELEILDEILNFQIKKIPDRTRFWMIRTQKGYFYNEFILRKFVALAWNNIDETTDFSEDGKERLKDEIVLQFPEITRPSTVINKCNNFINEINEGDILVIPSKGSQYITFAIAGEYYEDAGKTLELEQTVIFRIKNKDVDINDVSCPYKKRRKIIPLRTLRSDDLNVSLYRAISNYHGISNLDPYAYQILNSLYNCYSYKEYTALVYNIRKQTPIRPRELNRLIYGNTECLCSIIPEENISTQMSLHSPGDIIYMLKDFFILAVDNWNIVAGLLVVVGGGSALTFQFPGIIDIVKKILSTPGELKSQKLDNEAKQLANIEKRLEIYQKLKDSGIEPESLIGPLEQVLESSSSLRAEPIVLGESATQLQTTADEDEESIDIDEEQL